MTGKATGVVPRFDAPLHRIQALSSQRGSRPHPTGLRPATLTAASAGERDKGKQAGAHRRIARPLFENDITTAVSSSDMEAANAGF